MFKKTALALALASVVTATSAVAAGSDGDDQGYWSFRNMGMMKMMDKDGDHKVSKAEFNKQMEVFFIKMDVNKDGYIDQYEWLGMQLN